jgi:hypothetical protein
MDPMLKVASGIVANFRLEKPLHTSLVDRCLFLHEIEGEAESIVRALRPVWRVIHDKQDSHYSDVDKNHNDY